MTKPNVNFCEKCENSFRTFFLENVKKVSLSKSRRFCLKCQPLDKGKPKRCVKCQKWFDAFQTVNNKKINLRHRKECLECYPFNHNKGGFKSQERKEKNLCRVCGSFFIATEKIDGIWRSRRRTNICWACKPVQKVSLRQFKCELCGKEFSGEFVQNNKLKKSYNRKRCYICSPPREYKKRFQYHELNKIIDGKNYRKCAKCEKFLELNIENFLPNALVSSKNSNRCRKCIYKTAYARNRKTKLRAIEFMGGKCQICEYNKYPGALEFHHRDPSKKLFGFGQKKTFNDGLIIELQKCILVCANCHREIHGGLHPKILDKEIL